MFLGLIVKKCVCQQSSGVQGVYSSLKAASVSETLSKLPPDDPGTRHVDY